LFYLVLAPPLENMRLHAPIKVILGDGDGVVGGVVVDYDAIGAGAAGSSTSNVTGLWKRLEGSQRCDGWTGPQCPNATYKTPPNGRCDPFCLFRLDTDPGEHDDLAARPEYADVAADLKLRMDAANKTGFHPDRGQEDPQSCIAALQQHGGYWGPWVTPTD
jgi:hypothetical protein